MAVLLVISDVPTVNGGDALRRSSDCVLDFGQDLALGELVSEFLSPVCLSE